MMIASRILKLREGNRDIEVPVTIFAPECEKPGVWACRYEIGWPEGGHSIAAYGFDSIQALVIAMGMIGAEIYGSSYHKKGELIWSEPGKGYGFPVPPSLRDLLVGDDTKYL